MNELYIAHADHGVEAPHIAFLERKLRGMTPGFLRMAWRLPKSCPDLRSALYGPSVGDDPVPETEVRYVIRGKRRCASRLVPWPHRPARWIVAIGQVREAPRRGEARVLLFTSYGCTHDVVAPREPGDVSIPDWEGIVESRAFWAEHALAE